MGPGRWSGRVPAWQPSTGHHASKLVLTCHDQLPVVQPRRGRALAIHGEVILRQRVCRGSGCHAVFWICQHCDRGQHYCSLACRTAARLQQRRSANCRHQRSLEGRLDHRDRQRAYRRRQAQARVTGQGSLSIISPAPCGCGTPGPTRIAQSWPAQQPVRLLCCIICGRKGCFVDPFPRIPRSGLRKR